MRCFDERQTNNISESMLKEHLRAGAALADITPTAGTHLSGSGCGEHRPAQSVLDPLFAKAIVFESSARRTCIVTLDVTIITSDYTDKIRSAISEKTGVPSEAIMVHAIQTHSAPSLGYFMLDPYDHCRILIRRPHSEETEKIEFPDDDPYLTEDKVFLDAVRSGDNSGIRSSYTDALKTFELTWAITDAATVL